MDDVFRISIKPLTSVELDAILDIDKEAYGEHHWSKDAFYNELSNELAHYVYAQTQDGEVVGYGGFWGIIDEAHITTLAVKTSYRKKHIAQALLLEIIKNCYSLKIKYITLEVRVGNVPAIGLYEKNGFFSIGVRKGYYQDNNEDALIMFTQNIFDEKFKVLYNTHKVELNRVEVLNG